MTLYLHKFNDRTHVSDGLQPVLVPAGWLIADVDADDVRVCSVHAWQNQCLVVASGDACGAAACGNLSSTGTRAQLTRWHIFNFSPHLKLGTTGYSSGNCRQDAHGARSTHRFIDVLLRRRA